MRIAILDDAITDCSTLYDYLSKYCMEEHLPAEIRTFQDGNEFMKVFQKEPFNLVFLDIYMNEPNGIEVAVKIRETGIPCLIVFSTSSQTHAVKGFRVRAFDYLVKPYTYKTFSETMALCTRELEEHTKYIEVKEGRIFTKIFIEDIYHVDYHNHYIQIHTDRCTIRSYMPFPKFQELVKDYPQFLYCYRNCLINMKKVKSVEDTAFVLKNGSRVPISKKLKQQVRQSYADFVFSCVK